MKIGDRVSFGAFEWIVLALKQNQALLITKDIIFQRDYHSKSEFAVWETCELRHYLNSAFYSEFSEDEQKRIVEVINKTPDNLWYRSDGGPDTKDKVFVLSMDETVRLYFGDSSRLLDHPSPNQRYWFQRKDINNIRRRAVYSDTVWWWWTRTPGKHNRVAVYIHGDGNIGIQGNGISKTSFNTLHPKTHSNQGGVRPALWIQI